VVAAACRATSGRAAQAYIKWTESRLNIPVMIMTSLGPW
jgi:hypothetical protein